MIRNGNFLQKNGRIFENLENAAQNAKQILISLF